MSEELKTIKELADELGVSKDKIKYRVRKLPSELTTKVNGVTYLKNEAIKRIYKDIEVKIPTYNRVDIPTLPTENTHLKKDKEITIPTDYLLEELKKKDIELENKNKQIDNLIESQKQTQNLLDQQQRLALQDKQLLKEYQAEINDLKALHMPAEDIKEEQSGNQPQEVPVVEETTEVPRKWWKFWK